MRIDFKILDSSLRHKLYTIGKVWGTAKYRMMIFCSSHYDVDKELFRLLSGLIPSLYGRHVNHRFCIGRQARRIGRIQVG